VPIWISPGQFDALERLRRGACGIPQIDFRALINTERGLQRRGQQVRFEANLSTIARYLPLRTSVATVLRDKISSKLSTVEEFKGPCLRMKSAELLLNEERMFSFSDVH
jgi:hypothetical protein